ncbi:MAG: GGDEF domain-containing protein [Pseudomonadota bacterium]
MAPQSPKKLAEQHSEASGIPDAQADTDSTSTPGNGEAQTLKNRRKTAAEILRSVGECMYEWDIASDSISWSDGAEALLCVDRAGLIASGRRFSELLLPTTTQTRENTILSSSDIDHGGGVPYRIQYALSAERLQTTSDIWLEDSGRWFADAEGTPVRAHGVLRIINERRAAEERLDRLSRYDPLTGLFNRSHLNVCLERQLEQIKQSGEAASFIVVGLEHFDLINSVYGYDSGDAVIREVARKLQGNLRDEDIIGRFTGAKIGIILPAANERDMLVAGHRVLDLLRKNVVVTEKGPIAVSICVGGVAMPEHARDLREVFMAAHQALRESRRARDASIVSYRPNPQKDQERFEAAHTAEKIITALKEGRVKLAWQPVVDARTSQVVFHEALVRLQTEDGTALRAGDFVSVAQGLGLIRLVDHYALDIAMEALQASPDARLSLNVTYETASDPEWLAKLAVACSRTTGLAERLIVEITESYAAEHLDEARQFILSVKELGCQVALDDFGAGFTSFRNLKSLPFDIIKIDGQFAHNISNSIENNGFIKALVDIANLFGVKTVVEWVEDAETAKALKELGVDYLQGFAFGQPSSDLPWYCNVDDDTLVGTETPSKSEASADTDTPGSSTAA